MVDARLKDGSRHPIIPPLAIDGAVLSIRCFGATPLTASWLKSELDKDIAEMFDSV